MGRSLKPVNKVSQKIPIRPPISKNTKGAMGNKPSPRLQALVNRLCKPVFLRLVRLQNDKELMNQYGGKLGQKLEKVPIMNGPLNLSSVVAIRSNPAELKKIMAISNTFELKIPRTEIDATLLAVKFNPLKMEQKAEVQEPLDMAPQCSSSAQFPEPIQVPGPAIDPIQPSRSNEGMLALLPPLTIQIPQVESLNQLVLANPQPAVIIREMTNTPDMELVPMNASNAVGRITPEVITLDSDSEVETGGVATRTPTNVQRSSVVPPGEFDFLMRTIVAEIAKGNGAYVESWQKLLFSMINRVTVPQARSHWRSLRIVVKLRTEMNNAEAFMRQVETLLLQRAHGAPPQL